MADNYGWELLSLACPETVNSKENTLIKLIHWTITRCGYVCCGLGPTDACNASSQSSETLPTGWDLLCGDCVLQYKRNGDPYLLRTVRADQNLVVNFVRSRDKVMRSMLFDIDTSVAEFRGTLPERVPSYSLMTESIKSNLITPFGESPTHDAETQTAFDVPPSHAEQANERFMESPRRRSDWDPVASRALTNVGRNDLDPLSGVGHGGGMLFNPFGEARRNIRDPGLGNPGTGLPRGAVPPGARFDPISPFGLFPGSGGRVGPNPDHLPPPGYEDMFL